MGRIVCATRGGAGSRAVQNQATAYARQRNWELIFLYIIDMTRMSAEEELLKPAVRAELAWLGKTILRIAQKRAEKAGIKSEAEIREGTLRIEICRFLEEKKADLLLIGAPKGTTAHISGDDVIEQFATDINQQTGVNVEIVRPEIADLDRS